jgi:hypothetical protein
MMRTGEDGDDCFMDCLDLFLLEEIARKEGCDQQHDDNEERP